MLEAPTRCIASQVGELAVASCEDIDDVFGHAVLHGKQIFRQSVVAGRPQINPGASVDKLHADAHSLLICLQGPLDHIISIQFSSDRSHVIAPALVGKHGLASDYS